MYLLGIKSLLEARNTEEKSQVAPTGLCQGKFRMFKTCGITQSCGVELQKTCICSLAAISGVISPFFFFFFKFLFLNFLGMYVFLQMSAAYNIYVPGAHRCYRATVRGLGIEPRSSGRVALWFLFSVCVCVW